MLEELAGSSAQDATDALEELTADPELLEWQTVVTSRLDSQKSVRIASEYQNPSIIEICRTLKGGLPATCWRPSRACN